MRTSSSRNSHSRGYTGEPVPFSASILCAQQASKRSPPPHQQIDFSPRQITELIQQRFDRIVQNRLQCLPVQHNLRRLRNKLRPQQHHIRQIQLCRATPAVLQRVINIVERT